MLLYSCARNSQHARRQVTTDGTPLRATASTRAARLPQTVLLVPTLSVGAPKPIDSARSNISFAHTTVSKPVQRHLQPYLSPSSTCFDIDCASAVAPASVLSCVRALRPRAVLAAAGSEIFALNVRHHFAFQQHVVGQQPSELRQNKSQMKRSLRVNANKSHETIPRRCVQRPVRYLYST